MDWIESSIHSIHIISKYMIPDNEYDTTNTRNSLGIDLEWHKKKYPLDIMNPSSFHRWNIAEWKEIE